MSCTLTIDVTRELGQVSPRVFGHFIEHFPRQVYGGVYEEGSEHADAHGFRADVVTALKELGTPLIRWPGGNYTSAYHWRWGAVPRKYRPTIYHEPVWQQTEPHTFGTPEFLELCGRVGAEPLICVGLGRDPWNPTPDEAAAWVRYCNAARGPEAELREEAGHRSPLNVLLWGLGNEVYGDWQIGRYAHPSLYAKDLLTYARAMREADPRIQFVACGHDPGWNRAVLTDDVARTVDWISFHDYFHLGWAGPRRRHGAACEHLVEIEAHIEKLAQVNREASRRAGRERPLALAIDEWNEFGWAEPERSADNDRPQTYDLAHALYTAAFLNILVRHPADVALANYSPSVNCRGLIYADPRGTLIRATYHVFHMYRPCMGATAVGAELTAPPLDGTTAPVLDAAALRANDGALLVFVVNRDPERPADCQMRLRKFTVKRSKGRILTAAALNVHNDFTRPGRLVPGVLPANVRRDNFGFAFPPRSLSLLRLEG